MNNSYITFFKEHTNLILFGFMLTFFSAFGQTFVIALYVPEIIRDFDLSNASFASVYAGATILSALCLTWAGRFIDLIDLRKYAWMVLGGMVISLLIFSQANHIIWLGLGLWGMRLCGQGLMSHTAISTMARYFDHVRGKAISITTLGHPAGGAVFPLLIAFSIQAFGWRNTLIASAAVVALLVPAMVAWLLRKVNTDPTAFRTENDPQQTAKAQEAKKRPSYKDIINTRIFWIIAPAAIALPLLNTAFFFYQIPLGESKGWSTEWVAGSFTAYAAAGAFFTIVAGQFIDKLSAGRMFPFYLFPMLAAMLLVVFFDSPWITPAYLALIGITNGFGNPIKSALQAEVFGVEYIGAVRSLFTALMVVSTAIGPALFGVLLDTGLGFEEVIALAALYLVFTILWSFRIVPKTRMLRWYAKLKPQKAGH